ncbi:MAG: cytochrome d ubiquinol oxidase subunit II [Pseudomonadota bacterium]
MSESMGTWLPLAFYFLMGLSMLIYSITDGYDLGVGILTLRREGAQRDRMIASIGPFWDANETWLVLGVGILLVAFPTAHGVVLTNLYLPATVMLISLIFRGVAFDFRAKVAAHQQAVWNRAFFIGSLLAAFTQGCMLGQYIVGFDSGVISLYFTVLVGAALVASYTLIGACWLVLKCEGELQRRAIEWAKRSLLFTALGIALVSLTTPLASARIFDKWFSFPELFLLAPIPLTSAALVVALYLLLRALPLSGDRFCWLPFALVVGLFVLCFHGLAYSFYPYIVPDQLLIVDAAAAPESLLIIFVGTCVVLPVLFAYTVFVYRVFRGKASPLSYQ